MLCYQLSMDALLLELETSDYEPALDDVDYWAKQIVIERLNKKVEKVWRLNTPRTNKQEDKGQWR